MTRRATKLREQAAALAELADRLDRRRPDRELAMIGDELVATLGELLETTQAPALAEYALLEDLGVPNPIGYVGVFANSQKITRAEARRRLLEIEHYQLGEAVRR